MDASVHAPGPEPEELLRHAAFLRRLARELVADGARADDLVQETWVAALERPPARSENLRGWLARVLSNRARSLGRSQRRRARREAAAARGESLPSTDELLAELELQRKVAQAVRELDEPYRRTLLLRFQRDLAPSAIAREEGVPAATVRSRLKRGLAELRERLDREHGGDRRAWSVALLAWAGPERPLAGTAAVMLGACAVLVLAGAAARTMWRPSTPPATSSTGAVELAASASDASSGSFSQGDAAPAEALSSAAAREVAPLAEPSERATATADAYVGCVRDPAGDPIEGARIALYPSKRWPRPAPIGTGTTGADGRFAIVAEPTTSTYLVIGAEADGFQGLTMDPVVVDREIAIELGWLVELHGVVRDAESGAPIAGAWISCGETSTRSEADGRYRLPGVRAGHPGSIHALATGHAPVTRDVFVRGKEPQRLDLALARGLPIDVEVVDRETGVPLVGVEVLGAEGGAPWTRTDAQGRFVAWYRPEQPIRLRLASEDHWPLRWSWTPSREATDTTARLTMLRRAWLEGMVTAEDGSPIDGAWSSIRSEGHFDSSVKWARRRGTPGEIQDDTWGLPSEVTRPDGRFRIAIVPCDRRLTIEFGRAGFLSVSRSDLHFPTSSPTPPIHVVLPRAGTIRGRVRFCGEPWSGFVRAGEARKYLGPSAGVFTLDVPPGTWRVFLSEEGDDELADGPSRIVTVAAGEEVECDLEWSIERGEIAGRARTTSGAAAIGTDILAWDESGDRVLAVDTTDDAGRFVLAVPRGIGVIVQASAGDAPGWAPSPTVSGRVGDPPLELVLPELTTLRMQLVDGTTGVGPDVLARSLSDALRARRVSDGFECAQDLEIDLAGVVEVELLAGEHDLALDLTASGYLPVTTRATVTADAPPLVVEVVRGIQARVRLRGEAHGGPTPLTGHLVFLVERGQLGRISGPLPEGLYNHRINGIRMRIDDPALMEQMLTGDFHETGSADLPCLAPGRYVVKCYPDDFVFEPAELDVRGPLPMELDVRWRPR